MSTAKTKDIRNAEEVVLNEVITRQVAAIAITGASAAEIARQLNISPSSVRRIFELDKYKEIVIEVAKAGFPKLLGKALRAVEDVLDTGGSRDKLQAATIVFKAVGLAEEEGKPQDTQIIVQLPNGIETPITYEVKHDDNTT